MPRYSFTSTATVSIVTNVEADTLKEAMEELDNRGMMTYCNHCITNGAEDSWVAEELDGDPQELLSITVDNEDVPEKDFKRCKKKFGR